MELKREHLRAMIYYDFKCGLTEVLSLERLKSALGESAPSRATIFRWFNEFKRGKTNLEDDDRSGRPQTAVTAENVWTTEMLVRDDPRITYRDIENILGISSVSVHTILHEHLGTRKLCCRWIPRLLSETEKEARVDWCREMRLRFENGRSRRVSEIVTGDETWIYQYDPESKKRSSVWVFPDGQLPTKLQRPRNIGKKMVASFFSRSGHLATSMLENCRSVNSEWYTTVALPKVFKAVQERRPKTGLRGMMLHHDNASSHSSLRTKAFIQESGIETLPHPPYSPDLAPCDFFLFPTIKDKIKGKYFSSAKEAVAAYESAIFDLSDEDWNKCFQDWFRRMEICIENDGEYFEKI